MPRLAMACVRKRSSACPLAATVPDATLDTIPMIVRSSVDLPAPLGPMITQISPGPTSRDMSRMTGAWPYELVRSWTDSIAMSRASGAEIRRHDFRVGLYFGRSAGRNPAAGVDHHDLVAQRHNDIHVVFDQQDSQVVSILGNERR